MISKEGISQIKKLGCCLGKYRALINGTYFCSFGGQVTCKGQSRQFFEKIDGYLTVCEPDSQYPCQECEKYQQHKSSIAIQTLPARNDRSRGSISEDIRESGEATQTD
jgi:hypothetical protein